MMLTDEQIDKLPKDRRDWLCGEGSADPNAGNPFEEETDTQRLRRVSAMIRATWTNLE